MRGRRDVQLAGFRCAIAEDRDAAGAVAQTLADAGHDAACPELWNRADCLMPVSRAGVRDLLACVLRM